MMEQGATNVSIKLAKKGGTGPGGSGKGARPVLSLEITSMVSFDATREVRGRD